MTGRRGATLAAAITGAAALVIVPTWTGASSDKPTLRPRRRRSRATSIVLQGDGMATAQRDLIRLVTKGNEPGETS